MNVERISAVTVLDSADELCGPSGRSDRIVSGFQASFDTICSPFTLAALEDA